MQFLDENGENAVQLCQELKEDTGDINNGWYVVKGTVNYSGTISGVVNLVLADGCSLNAASGLTLANDTKLTVYAQSTGNRMGKLIANNSKGSGIEGDKGIYLIVTGGSIQATGSSCGIFAGAITGGRVEAKGTAENGVAFNYYPEISVGMRVVDGESGEPVEDPKAFFNSRPNHVIIERCKDHPVTKGGSYIDANTHYLACAYCNLTVEGTAVHSFNEKGICSCGAVRYLDENGATKTQFCQVISSDRKLQENGWYVWDGEGNNDLRVYGDSNLILTEDSTLTADAYLHRNSLTVYGQPGSCLTLSCYHSDGTLNIRGGLTVIDSTDEVDNLNLNVNGGILVVNKVDGTTLNVDNQRGIYLKSGVGQVAGDFTLNQSFTLAEGQTLTILENAKLTIASQNTRAAASYLENNGIIYVDGELEGDVSGTGEVYYLVTLPNGVTAKLEDGTELHTYDGKLYAKAGQKIVLSGGTEDGYLVSGSSITGSTFTMGAKVAVVTEHTHSFNDDDGFCKICDAYQPATQNAETGYYQISNAGQLFWVAAKVNSDETGVNGQLTADIQIPVKADGSTRDWTPIGSETKKYSGTFDGKGFTISGLYFNDSSASYVGLFGYVNGGTIQNVTVAGEFTGDRNVGGICGYLKNGAISGCTNTAKVTGFQNIGGICGTNHGEITNCHNSGSIKGQEDNSTGLNRVGGICGLCFGTIERCSNSGEVSAKEASAGGITGSLGENASVKDCWNTGSVAGTTEVGGISGYLYVCSITNCYSIGTVSGANDSGPVCGEIVNNATITNCYYLQGTGSEMEDISGTTVKTTDQFASGEVAYLLNADRSTTVWGQTIGSQSYPVLGGETVYRALKCDGLTIDHYINGTEDIILGHVAPGADGKCPVCQAVILASVETAAEGASGTISYYTTMDAAFQAASENTGSTLRLLHEVTESQNRTIGGTFTLDLNGCKLTLNTFYYTISSGANVTIQGEGTMTAQIMDVEGELTIRSDGVTIEPTVQIKNGGNLTVSGGIFGIMYIESGSSASITGGTVNGDIKLAGESHLTITGGTIKSDGINIDTFFLNKYVTISGGSFTSQQFKINCKTFTGEPLVFPVSISGGSFKHLEASAMSEINGTMMFSLKQLLAEGDNSNPDGYWFFKQKDTAADGTVTYSDWLTEEQANQQEYTETLYVAPHSHTASRFDYVDGQQHEKYCYCGAAMGSEPHTLYSTETPVCLCGYAAYLDGTNHRYQACQFVTASGTTWGEAGETTWYVVSGNPVDISDRIDVTGTVNLILADGCQLNAQKGIHVPNGTSLTIWAQSTGERMGTLNATTTDNWQGNDAAIGGNERQTSGIITIHGGNVEATSRQKGAAIGGGFDGEGNIHIHGGNVTATATSHKGGTAIGGGCNGAAGTIEITGGTITATSHGCFASGIGSVRTASGGSVTISGGTVTATGGGASAYNFAQAGRGIDASSIVISGGEVTAVGGNGDGEFANGEAFSTAPDVSKYTNLKLSTGDSENNLTAVEYSVRTAEGYNGYTASKAVKLQPCTNRTHSIIYTDMQEGTKHSVSCQYCGKGYIDELHFDNNADGKCDHCEVKLVASVEGNQTTTSYYSLFEPALKKANETTGSTLTLLDDVTVSKTQTVTGTFTLDLNGKNIIGTGGETDHKVYPIQVGKSATPYVGAEPDDETVTGTLTIKSTGNTGEISGSEFAIENRNGTLTIEDGKVAGIVNYSTLVIKGGTIEHSLFAVNNLGGNVTVENGKLSGENCVVNSPRETDTGAVLGTVTIKGGMFTFNGTGDFHTFGGATKNVTLTGGKFISGISIEDETASLKALLGKNDKGEIAYWYYTSFAGNVYSGEINAEDANAASYSSTVYVASHAHTLSYAQKDNVQHTKSCFCGSYDENHNFGADKKGTCPCGAEIVATVTIDGVATDYISLNDAFEAANGKTAEITLLKSVDIRMKTLTISGGEITFNGGDYTITAIDTAIKVNGNGKLNFRSGTISTSVYGANFVYDAISVTDGNAEVNITGGTVDQVTANGGQLNVAGGEIGRLVVKKESKTRLSGGSFQKIENKIFPAYYFLKTNYAYKLPDGTWVDATHGTNGKDLSAGDNEWIQVLPVPVKDISGPEATTTMTYGEDKSLTVTAEPTKPGDTVSYQWYEVINADGMDKKLEGETNSSLNLSAFDVGTHQFFCKATVDGYDARSQNASVSIEKKNIQNATIALGTALTYNGTEQTQSITSVVVDGLTVTYDVINNTGTDAKGYTLTVTGNGNFAGTAQEQWSIAAKDISKAKITLGAALTYNGNMQTQSVSSVVADSLAVTYDVTNNTATDAGSHTLTVTGKGNFQGTATADFVVNQLPVTVSGITARDKTYDGSSNATLVYTAVVLAGKLEADQLTATATGTFEDAKAGENKKVTISGITLSGSSAKNYCPADKGQQTETKATISKKMLTVENTAVSDKQYDGLTTASFKKQPTLNGVVDGDDVTLSPGTPSFVSAQVSEDPIQVEFSAFTISGADSGNYDLTQPEPTTARITNSFTPVNGENGSYTTTPNSWTNQNFVVTANPGYKLSLDNSATGTWEDTLTVSTEGEGSIQFYVRRNDDGAISQLATEYYKVDKTAPTGTILFDGVDETESSPRIVHKKADVTVTITGRDDRSGVASVSYLLSNAEKSNAELKTSTDWTQKESFTIKAVDGAKCFVYTKVVDNAGNVAYFRANQILFDTTAPSITGVENGKTYYTTQTVTISDSDLKELTLNGEPVQSPITLPGDVDKVYTIKAVDKVGNVNTVTVTMKPIETLTEKVEKVDEDTVNKGNKEELEDAKKQLENLPDTATEEERKKVDDLLKQIDGALDTLKNTADVEQLIDELPKPENIRPDDENAEQEIKDVQKRFDDLTNHEQNLLDESMKQKLKELQAALVNYRIISGDGSTWNRGSSMTQVFAANGSLKKFQELKLDGTTLSDANYTKEAGSTIITFQPAFLQSLALGSHTIQFIYSDGQTSVGSFEVKRSVNYLDLTGNPDFEGQNQVDMNGQSYPIEELGGNRYVNLPESGDLLTIYTYLTGTDEASYSNYPTGMQVYRINRSENGTTVTLIPELTNLLQYSGCSIRITGKSGIRMITSLTQANKDALRGSGLAGYTLEEYGTVVQWADTLGGQDLTLDNGKHNYAYKNGVADPVYNTTGGLTQYTNVLVGFSKDECSKNIIMRPYIILKDAAGTQYTLYGGFVTRSISYIAWQNRNTYQPGTNAYNYVHELMGGYQAA